jgi:hypothetical protein
LRISSPGEGQSPSFEQFRIPSPQGWYVPSVVESGPVVLEKRVYRQTDRQTDGGRTTGDQNSSLELSAQVS